MIVNYIEEGWEIITQRAHGLLAAQAAMEWRIADRPERWAETVAAITEHDDAQTELEEDDLLTSNGGPVNFTMKKFESKHCRRLQDYSLSKSRYIALLTSMHMNFLHHAEAETNTAAKAFLNEQAALREAWCKDLKITKKEANRIYNLMEWCDAFSLLLCRHEVPPENRVIEVSQGPDRKQYKLSQKKNGALSIKPWPFEYKSFKLRVEYRIIPKLQFKDCNDFKDEFLKAPVNEKVWELEK